VPVEPCERPTTQPELVEALVERDQCERDLAEASARVEVEVRERTRVVTKQGPPRRCGGAPPDIVPVSLERCDKGRACLSEQGELRLARNLAAYEAWVAQVLECEER
jgi:hypothetical protein